MSDDEAMGVESAQAAHNKRKKEKKRSREQRDQQTEENKQSDDEQGKEKKQRKSTSTQMESQSEQSDIEDASRRKKKSKKSKKKEKKQKKSKSKHKESASEDEESVDESSSSSDGEEDTGDIDDRAVRKAAKAQRKADRAERRRLKALKRDLRAPMSRKETSSSATDDPSVESVHYRKKGFFTPREKQVVQTALEQYAASHGMEKSDIDRLIGRKRLPEHVGVFKEIAQCLPLRQYHAVYEHIVRTGNVARNRKEAGTWPPEDIENLKRLYEEYGPKWSKIGTVLNRTDKDVRDKHRTISREFKTGKWTKEETQQLSLWVHKQAALGQQYRGDVVLQPDGLSYATSDGNIITPPESGILWTAISQIMRDRSHMQCRKHWYDTLAPKLKFAALNRSNQTTAEELPSQSPPATVAAAVAAADSSDEEALSSSQQPLSQSSNATVSVHQWTLEEDKVLLEKLYAQGADSVFEVDWKSLTNTRFPLPHMVRAHFIWLRDRLCNSKARFAQLNSNAEGKFDELVRKIRKHLWERQEPHQVFYFVPQQRLAPANDAEKEERERKFQQKKASLETNAAKAEAKREERQQRRLKREAGDEESKEGDDDDDDDDLEHRRSKEESELQSSRAEARRAAEAQAKLLAEQGQQAKQAAAEKRLKEQKKREKKLLKQNKLVSLAEKRRQEAIQAAVAARSNQGAGEEKENNESDDADEGSSSSSSSSSDSDDAAEFRSQGRLSSNSSAANAPAAASNTQASHDILTQPVTQSSHATPQRPVRSSATAASTKKRATPKPSASKHNVEF